MTSMPILMAVLRAPHRHHLRRNRGNIRMATEVVLAAAALYACLILLHLPLNEQDTAAAAGAYSAAHAATPVSPMPPPLPHAPQAHSSSNIKASRKSQEAQEHTAAPEEDSFAELNAFFKGHRQREATAAAAAKKNRGGDGGLSEEALMGVTDRAVRNALRAVHMEHALPHESPNLGEGGPARGIRRRQQHTSGELGRTPGGATTQTTEAQEEPQQDSEEYRFASRPDRARIGLGERDLPAKSIYRMTSFADGHGHRSSGRRGNGGPAQQPNGPDPVAAFMASPLGKPLPLFPQHVTDGDVATGGGNDEDPFALITVSMSDLTNAILRQERGRQQRIPVPAPPPPPSLRRGITKESATEEKGGKKVESNFADAYRFAELHNTGVHIDAENGRRPFIYRPSPLEHPPPPPPPPTPPPPPPPSNLQAEDEAERGKVRFSQRRREGNSAQKTGHLQDQDRDVHTSLRTAGPPPSQTADSSGGPPRAGVPQPSVPADATTSMPTANATPMRDSGGKGSLLEQHVMPAIARKPLPVALKNGVGTR